MQAERAHPFRRENLERRTAPFLVAILAPFALLPLAAPGERETDLVLAAAGLTALIVLAVPLVPWGRRPRADAALPPLAYLVVVALLREADGGSASGYAVLVLVPVLWLALYGSRAELVAVLGAAALALGIPVFVEGEPGYPPGEWRTAALATMAAGLAGFATQEIVRRTRDQAAEAARAAAELERALEERQESDRFLLSIMRSAAEGIVTLDPSGVVEFVNPAAAGMLGYEAEELLYRPLHDAIHHTRPDGTPYPEEDCPVRGSLLRGETHQVGDEVFWRKDGTSFPVEYRSTPIRWKRGPSGVVLTFVDITERREVERLKDEFISVVGHELRTPLTSIRGSLGLMAGGVYGELSEEARRMLGIAVSNTDRLVRLINDILDIERIESGRMPMVRQLCDLDAILGQLAELMGPTADEAGVRLEIGQGTARLWADPDRILQALTNLVSNAIKFSPPGDAVAVVTEPGDAEVVVRVSDRGRGIPQDRLGAIFERFAQIDASDSREKGGTGLGLAIARSIVDLHGGRIWAEQAEGGGSRFSLALPLAGAVAAAPDAGRPLVLVCDADGTARAATVALLERSSYAVATAATADEALARAAGEPRPAVILLDHAGASELLGALRDSDETRSIPVIVLGAVPVAGEDGAVAWLTKPPDAADLAAALERALGDDVPVRALVVEDDLDLARVLMAVFDRRGIAAEHAPTAQEAIERIGAEPPDLLVLDLILPDGDGADVVAWLRARDLPPMPIVVYTARDLDAASRERLELGDTQFLTKSRVSPAEFERRIVGVVDRLSAERRST